MKPEQKNGVKLLQADDILLGVICHKAFVERLDLVAIAQKTSRSKLVRDIIAGFLRLRLKSDTFEVESIIHEIAGIYCQIFKKQDTTIKVKEYLELVRMKMKHKKISSKNTEKIIKELERRICNGQ